MSTTILRKARDLALAQMPRASVVELSLPVPPSANNLTFNTEGGRSRTKQYNAWRTEAGQRIQISRPKHIPGEVSIEIAIQDRGRRDLDNFNKPVIDLLVAHGIIEQDTRNIVRSIWTRWDAGVGGCRVRVERVGI